MGLYKEYYATAVLENFYPAGGWLEKLTSMDAFVEFNKLNIAQVGADPQVVKDNGTWPLVPVEPAFTNNELLLSTFDTKPTHVTKVKEMETNFDYAKAVLAQHGKSLYKQAVVSAAFNIAPAGNTANTPVKATATAGKIAFADIIDMAALFDAQDLPADDRVLLLNPKHLADLRKENQTLFNDLIKNKEFYGFQVFITTATPTYTTLAKDPIGTATPGKIASICFCASEVFRAMGTVEGEPEERWADYRGWLIGIQMRFLAMPVRMRGIGAIVTQ